MQVLKTIFIDFQIFYLYFVIFCVVYIASTFLLAFLKRGKTSKGYLDAHPVSRFFSDGVEGNDRIALMDDPQTAGRWRIQLINQAQKTLDISYHTLIPGVYSDMFFGALFEAAERGVKVRFISDGVVGGMKKKLGPVRLAMQTHPNIELGLYEPLDFFKPWTWNNRLHDKFLVADGKVAIMGGRNIGDKLYQPKGYDGKLVFDRDVLIMRTDASKPSVIDQIQDYSNLLWSQKFMLKKRLTKPKAVTAMKATVKDWMDRKAKQATEHPEFITPVIEDWTTVTMPTDKITLVSNPMGRWSKAPWIWDEMMNLFNEAKKRVLVQSPYIVPLKFQLDELDDISKKGISLTYLTNSMYSSPNIPGFSGYQRQKWRIRKWGPIYEYMGPGSIHSKSALVDDTISIVGSFNLDPRSLYLDTETMLVIDSAKFNNHLSDIAKLWMDACACNNPDKTVSPPANADIKMKKPSFGKKCIIRIAQVILWPLKMLV